MDDKEAKKLLKGISDLRFYSVYIDKQLASDFSIDLAGHIDHLQSENAKLKQDINKIKADAIREFLDDPRNVQVDAGGFDEFAWVDVMQGYADRMEKGEIE